MSINTISALKLKYRELLWPSDNVNHQCLGLQYDIEAVGRTLCILGVGDLSELKPKRVNKSHKRFASGTMNTHVIDVMRLHNQAMSTREIGEAVKARTGMSGSTSGPQFRSMLIKCMNKLEADGIYRRHSMRGKAIVWETVPLDD